MENYCDRQSSPLRDVKRHIVHDTLPRRALKGAASLDYLCLKCGPNDCRNYDEMQILPVRLG